MQSIQLLSKRYFFFKISAYNFVCLLIIYSKELAAIDTIEINSSFNQIGSFILLFFVSYIKRAHTPARYVFKMIDLIHLKTRMHILQLEWCYCKKRLVNKWLLHCRGDQSERKEGILRCLIFNFFCSVLQKYWRKIKVNDIFACVAPFISDKSDQPYMTKWNGMLLLL